MTYINILYLILGFSTGALVTTIAWFIWAVESMKGGAHK